MGCPESRLREVRNDLGMIAANSRTRTGVARQSIREVEARSQKVFGKIWFSPESSDILLGTSLNYREGPDTHLGVHLLGTCRWVERIYFSHESLHRTMR